MAGTCSGQVRRSMPSPAPSRIPRVGRVAVPATAIFALLRKPVGALAAGACHSSAGTCSARRAATRDCLAASWSGIGRDRWGQDRQVPASWRAQDAASAAVTDMSPPGGALVAGPWGGAVTGVAGPRMAAGDEWSRLSDSNRRPAVYKTAALPTELKRRAAGQAAAGAWDSLSQTAPRRETVGGGTAPVATRACGCREEPVQGRRPGPAQRAPVSPAESAAGWAAERPAGWAAPSGWRRRRARSGRSESEACSGRPSRP